MHLFIILFVCIYSQCVNVVVAISRQITVLLEQEIQVGLSRQAAHSLLGNYGAALSQSKSQGPVITVVCY